VELQITLAGELSVGVYHDGTGDAQLASQVAGAGEPGPWAERQVPNSPAELVLDLAAESAGAFPVYGDEDVQRATSQVVLRSRCQLSGKSVRLSVRSGRIR
jgi:hypothetical protein